MLHKLSLIVWAIRAPVAYYDIMMNVIELISRLRICKHTTSFGQVTDIVRLLKGVLEVVRLLMGGRGATKGGMLRGGLVVDGFRKGDISAIKR